jgi:predicted TIM-barrel fold metal-dependent hydrolase
MAPPLMPKHTDAAAKIADMDKAGIEMTALSINDPGPELFGKDSKAMAILLNDFIADTVRQHPKRFFGLATLPFHSPDEMMKEFDRAIGKLGMKGILLYSNLDGKFPDEPAYRPLYAEAERRGVPILLHPALPMTYNAVSDYQMVPMLGLMFDTTIALCRLILSGVLDRHPNLKLVCPHVGGALPFLIAAWIIRRWCSNAARRISGWRRARISSAFISTRSRRFQWRSATGSTLWAPTACFTQAIIRGSTRH